jgi:hypothetical protein
MVDWLDRVQLSDRDREIARAYLRSSEAVLDLVWFVGARIRTVFARGTAIRSTGGTGLCGQKRVAVQLP